MPSVRHMEIPAIPPDPALAALADTRGPLRRMSILSIIGMVFWMLVLGMFTVMVLNPAVAGEEAGAIRRLLVWSLLGVPVLLHLWPVAALRGAAKALTTFATEPTEAAATAAVRAQRLYWRAAGICHLLIVVWLILLAVLWIATR
jgi:hypothetical protein